MSPLPQPDAAVLAEALKAEYAAVFAYGVVEAHTETSAAQLAAQAAHEHRARRDDAVGRLAEARAEAPPSAAAYTLPITVADNLSAAHLALAVEAETAVAWRALIERATSAELRELGVRALTDCAVRAAQWRKTAAARPTVTPFPGADR